MESFTITIHGNQRHNGCTQPICIYSMVFKMTTDAKKALDELVESAHLEHYYDGCKRCQQNIKTIRTALKLLQQAYDDQAYHGMILPETSKAIEEILK